jgi:ATP-dependent protease ClpP protease subunit
MKRKASAQKSGHSESTAASLMATARSIYVQGLIDEDLFRSLTPRILQLKEGSSYPVAVLIDSEGGESE